MGGFYERLVGLVKRNLRKTIDSHLLTYRQLETVVIEVESVINSRPLGFVGSTLDDGITLTPALCLGIDHRTGFPEIDIDEDDADFKLKEDSSETLLTKLKKDQKVLDIFWKTFRDDYLLSFRERKNENKIRGAACDVPQVDQAVLIKENLPRGLWKIGLVQRILPGPDGEVRSAVVRTSKGKQFNRSIKLLYPLECINKEEKIVEKVTDINNGEEEEKEQINLKSQRGAADRARKATSELFRRECRAQRDFDN
ncbi:unnamed protein product [Didymodactylos carnosus]|uniref:DUF5641 domain-containing protein n=1 Tax=Didymodactylos carnosus TaxID=1234261 RepID=A0A815YTC0_9BILA|nr:unnamed protein product [Didymodactylos carnosus]CAF4438206.1 unnamed protein product [Didymodactylos carnosus]